LSDVSTAGTSGKTGSSQVKFTVSAGGSVLASAGGSGEVQADVARKRTRRAEIVWFNERVFGILSVLI
jgi:hypothetical protein